MSIGKRNSLAIHGHRATQARDDCGRSIFLSLLAAFFFWNLFVAASPSGAETGEPKITFYDKDGKKRCSFSVAIAATDEEQARGLMFREKMPRDYGMLFVYRDNEVRHFWMKNTFIPLDLIFLSPARKVVSIFFSARPMDETTISSVYPAKYVLEVSAGRAKECGIHIGTQARFVNIQR